MPSEKRPRGHRGGAKQRDRERKKRQATEAPITAFRVTRAASHSEPSRVWPPTTPYFSAPIGAASVGRTPIGAAPNTPGYRAPGSPVFSTGAPGTPPVTGGFRAPGTPTAGFRASGTPTGFGAPGTPTAGFGAPGSPNFSAGFGAATPPMNFGAPGTPPLQFRVPGTPPVEHQRLQEETEPSAPGEPTVKEESDAAYFEAYDQMEVHALMLNDSQRLGSYLAAIRAHHLKGKKVLDVGAGSGILSLLAAKHGLAEHVWAVEAVPGMAKLAQQLVDQNGLQDKVLDQRLLLQHGLHCASAAVARRSGWAPGDLETLLATYAEEPEMKEGLAEMHELHQSCLDTGSLPEGASAGVLGMPWLAENPWISGDAEKDSARALAVLKELGERKAAKLAELRSSGDLRGPRILQLCAAVERDFWAENAAADAAEAAAALGFGPAVVALDSKAPGFQESYTKLIKDLETQLPRSNTKAGSEC